MTISYNNNVPLSTNNPSVDQPNLLTNTQANSLIWGIDHYTFNEDHSGQHLQVTMYNQSAPALGAANGQLYCMANNPWWQNAAGNLQLAYLGPAMASSNGYITLGGVLFQWGSVNAPGAGSSIVSFPLAFTNPPFSIQLTPRNDGSHSAFTYYIDGLPTTTQFAYRGSTSGSNTLYWFAVGI